MSRLELNPQIHSPTKTYFIFQTGFGKVWFYFCFPHTCKNGMKATFWSARVSNLRKKSLNHPIYGKPNHETNGCMHNKIRAKRKFCFFFKFLIKFYLIFISDSLLRSWIDKSMPSFCSFIIVCLSGVCGVKCHITTPVLPYFGYY